MGCKMKRRTTTFFMSLALMIVATLFIAARSEPVKSNGDPGANATVDPSQTAPATEPAAPSPKTNGLKKAAPPNRLSFGVDEVVKMFQRGVESDVILNYVENSSVPYHLNAEEIVQLHDIGVPSPIVTA